VQAGECSVSIFFVRC